MIPLVCYSHTDYLDILNVQNTFLSSYDVPKIFMLNRPLIDKNVVLYDDKKNYSKRVLECLEKMNDEFILFFHDMDILLRYSPEQCEELVEFMKQHSIDRVDLQYSNGELKDEILFRDIYLTRNSSYVYNVNPSIWRRSALIDIMSTFDRNYREIEGKEVQEYMTKFNVYRLWSPRKVKAGYFNITNWFIFIHITHGGKLLPRQNNNLEPWIQVIYNGILSSFSFQRQVRTTMH
jgi:hypothetical protein